MSYLTTMKMFQKNSKYMIAKESVWRKFVRWAYTKYLDELYIPDGTEIRETAKGPNRHHRYVIRVGTSSVRRGNQQHYFE